MKKFQLWLLFLLLLLLAAIPVTVFLARQRQELRKRAVPATTLSFSPAAKTVHPDETFSLDVMINTGTNTVSAAELVIVFDENKLQALSIEPGDFLTVVLTTGATAASQATITLGSPPTSPRQGSGKLATVRFKALGSASGASSVRFSSATQVAGLGEQGNVLVGSTPASVTIQAASPTPTPTPTPTSGSSVTPTPTPTAGTGGGGNVTASIVYPADGSSVTTSTPEIRGTAPPGSTVTVTIYSDPLTAVVTADSDGIWRYTPTQTLADGAHTLNVTVQAPDGSTKPLSSSFVIASAPIPATGSTDLLYLLLVIGGALITLGVVFSRVFPLVSR